MRSVGVCLMKSEIQAPPGVSVTEQNARFGGRWFDTEGTQSLGGSPCRDLLGLCLHTQCTTTCQERAYLILKPKGEESKGNKGLARWEAGQCLQPAQPWVRSRPLVLICASIHHLFPQDSLHCPLNGRAWASNLGHPGSRFSSFCPAEMSDS